MPDGIGHETAKLIAKNAAMETGAEMVHQLRQIMDEGFSSIHNRITTLVQVQSQHGVHIGNHAKQIDDIKNDCMDELTGPKREGKQMNPLLLVIVTVVITSIANFSTQAFIRSIAKELPSIQSDSK